jgi:hypothetical protein
MPLTRRTRGLLFAAEAIWLALLVFALADREAHRRETDFGLNQWGYRDIARARKEPGEMRIALVGGSAAFEAGTRASDTMATQIFFTLQEVEGPAKRMYSVVNLSQPQAGADSYADTIRHYRFLGSDVVCFFDGYDTLGGLPPHAREHSFVFAATGYLPLLPARLLGRPGWMSDPDGGVADVLRDGRTENVSCSGVSRTYCASMDTAVRAALEGSRRVIVVSPPAVSRRHAEQQRSLAEALTRSFSTTGRFAMLDVGWAVDLSRKTQSADGIHRTVDADHAIGQQIAFTALRLLGRRE